MARTMPYFPFYPSDFLSSAKVALMTPAEVGAYVLLLCQAWQSDPPASLPAANENALARWARMTNEDWRMAKPAVMGAWVKRGGRWFQPRLESEWKKAAAAYEAKVEGGRKGGKRSAQGRLEDTSRSPTAMPVGGFKHSESDSDSDTNSEKPNTKTPIKPPEAAAGVAAVAVKEIVRLVVQAVPEGLVAEVYRNYPRLVGRAAAFAAIQRAAKSLVGRPNIATPTDGALWLLARTKAYAASPLVRTTPTQFIPHPSVWFNQGRFDDDDTEWQRERQSDSGTSNGSGRRNGQVSATARRAEKRAGEFTEHITLPVVYGSAGGDPPAGEHRGSAEAGAAGGPTGDGA